MKESPIQSQCSMEEIRSFNHKLASPAYSTADILDHTSLLSEYCNHSHYDFFGVIELALESYPFFILYNSDWIAQLVQYKCIHTY